MNKFIELTMNFALDVVAVISGFAYGFLVVSAAIFIVLLYILLIAFLV